MLISDVTAFSTIKLTVRKNIQQIIISMHKRLSKRTMSYKYEERENVRSTIL